ncbi:MAG: MotA/TolQ/ExbB proton channel family protein [Patescibacteria group bacterium]
MVLIPTTMYLTGAAGGAETLTTTSIIFVVYTIYLLVEVCISAPAPVIVQIPVMEIPTTIDRDNAATMRPVALTDDKGSLEGFRIVRNLLMQIDKAADASSIHSLIEAQFNTLRYENDQRYAKTEQRIASLAFIGFMGTVVGLMAFLAQVDVVLDLFDENSEAMLSQLDLTGVASAFLTTFIGLMGKAWVSKGIATDQNAQDESLIKLEKWIQQEILVRLNLPSQVTTYLTLKATSDLAEPLVAAMEGMQTVVADFQFMVGEIQQATSDQLLAAKIISEVIAPKLERMVKNFDQLEGMVIETRLVDGGYAMTLRKPGKGVN